MRLPSWACWLLDQSPDWEKLGDRYDARRGLLPCCVQNRGGPDGLEIPRVVDPNFDLSFHMRRFRMPEDSSWVDVLEERPASSPAADFDKDRPLWRGDPAGLPGGKAVLVRKLPMRSPTGRVRCSWAALLDFTEEGADLGPMPRRPSRCCWTPREPGAGGHPQQRRLGGAHRRGRAIRGFGPLAMTALMHPRTLFGKIRDTAGSVVRFTKVSVEPLSPILKGRSINYHFDTIDMDFDKFKAAAKRRDRTVNDLFLAAHQRRHERLPRRWAIRSTSCG